ncbi:protein PML-like [Oncorhynchus clarkii lewisi]|uniref:protein PML-like n=1 Tax=Oncorhynchus clarkii lewisi TaxID=490388 RepID=UPI0039B886AF
MENENNRLVVATSPGRSLVFFDLETTGLGQSCEIVQLAAVSGGHSLNLYTVPRCRMQRGAAKVTGFRVWRHRLYHHRCPVLTNSLKEVLVSFIAFLRMLDRPIVVGHNIRRFDCPVLARGLDEFDLKAEFQFAVSGCLDTLPLAREILKGRGLQSFRQENLVRIVVGISYEAHDALEDVRALQRLYGALRPTPEQVLRQSFTLDTMAEPAPKQPPAAKAKGSCRATGQWPLWKNFKQEVKVTEGPKGGTTGQGDATLIMDNGCK